MFSAGATMDASLRGRMKRGGTRRVLVGDEVFMDVHDDGSVTIEEIAERRSLLKRRTPGKSRGVRAIAANVDQVVVVGAADHPRWDPHLMDRFLVMAEANTLNAVVVVNKSDLVDDAAVLGGPYEGAELVIDEIPIVGKCRDCGESFQYEEIAFGCPNCDSRSVSIESGLELNIKQLEIDEANEGNET